MGHAKIKRLILGNNLFAREAGEEIIEIPVVLDQKEFVNALLQVKMDEEVLYKLFEGHNWESYGFDKEAALNADKVIAKLMEYEEVIWNTRFFKIDDNRLFNYWPVGVDKPASFYIGLHTNNITNDNVVYVYDDCDENGGTNGGGTGEGDDDDWTYTNGGLIEGGIAPGQPWTWVEPNETSPSGSPSGPKPICLTDIIHISGGTGGTGWSSTPVYSTSGGSSNGGGSGGGGDGPCTPFPWAGLGIYTGSGQYQALFNPCFEREPGDNGTPPVQVNDVDRSHLTDPCHIAAFDKIGADKLKAELVKMYIETYVGTNKVHNLTLWSSTNVPGPAGQGVVLANSDQDPVELNRWYILLSIHKLGNVLSEQAWVGMILHELVHSFIEKNNVGFNPFDPNNTHHTTMLNKWVNQIKDALKEICGMPDADALALALRGFDDVLKDTATGQFKPAMVTKIQQMFGVDLNVAKALADKYYNGEKGTVCP